MKLLVTGGAGFIGSNFIRYMIKAHPGDTIINFDALTYAGNPENLEDVQNNPHYHFVHGDICNEELLYFVVDQFAVDTIVNFAAASHVDRSIYEPGLFIKTNVLGTQTLLEVAKNKHIKKYLQISTDEVYGSLGSAGYFTEATPLAPNSPYAASKASADMIVRSYFETYGLDINITRCANNYGPWHFPEKLIPLIIINALENKELPVYGDGKNIRDWLYVDDHCAAIDLVLHQGKPGEVFNIGNHHEMRNIDLVTLILDKLNKPHRLINYVSDRPGHDRRYAIDASKIKAELGWQPQYRFETGINETIQWYLTHKKWWQKIRSGAYKSYYKHQYGSAIE
ncbi:dTDP-glucose 4,6-dehydratase [Sporolactobacillus vineae]|uniref:dTDP-glucose 4,6-dehydratase n=1 Tax=Sporolactobacillus vineae TaxID=444463 RepID=UPI0002887DFD|nr:dTDP-glucose 4,6-dehydratase [Sporolactobacillus vineae]